jgi:hypothetical protein
MAAFGSTNLNKKQTRLVNAIAKTSSKDQPTQKEVEEEEDDEIKITDS